MVASQARTGAGCDALPTHDAPVQNKGVMGWGRESHTSPGEGWVTGGPGLLLHTATPRWSPPCAIVTPPRWPAGGGACDPAPWPPRLDQGTPQIAC